MKDKVPMADQIVDDLLPEDFDWREIVRDYPLPAIIVAVAGGFLLGRRHGTDLLTALRRFADREVTQNLRAVLGDDAFRDDD
ncbi:MAG: hypothetical protein V3T72_10040 [Thermoanaerobaculia bacterium]